MYEPKFINPTDVYFADYETKLMGPQCLNPTGICFSIATMTVEVTIDPDTFEEDHVVTVQTDLVADGDECWETYMCALFDAALEDKDMIVVFHNAKFDLHVFVHDHPDYYSTLS